MHLIRHLVVIYLFLFSALTKAQTHLVILSEESEQLPYATITNTTSGFVYSADKNGEFMLECHNGDSILVSYVGHHPVKFYYKQEPKKVIRLNRIISEMRPVVIKPCEKYKSATIKSESSKSEMNGGYGGIGHTTYGTVKASWAVLIQPEYAMSYLKEFSFYLISAAAPISAFQAPFSISFYQVDDSTQLPGNAITNKPVFYYPIKLGKQTVYLDSLRIMIPQEGIYIGFQYIMDEKYAWPARRRDNTIDSSFRNYGVVIEGSFDKKMPLARFIHISQKWENYQQGKSIRFEAVLKYCK